MVLQSCWEAGNKWGGSCDVLVALFLEHYTAVMTIAWPSGIASRGPAPIIVCAQPGPQWPVSWGLNPVTSTARSQEGPCGPGQSHFALDLWREGRQWLTSCLPGQQGPSLAGVEQETPPSRWLGLITGRLTSVWAAFRWVLAVCSSCELQPLPVPPGCVPGSAMLLWPHPTGASWDPSCALTGIPASCLFVSQATHLVTMLAVCVCVWLCVCGLGSSAKLSPVRTTFYTFFSIICDLLGFHSPGILMFNSLGWIWTQARLCDSSCDHHLASLPEILSFRVVEQYLSQGLPRGLNEA